MTLEDPNAQLHIAVCDDEQADLRQTMKLTGELMREEGISCAVSGYESGSALLKAI